MALDELHRQLEARPGVHVRAAEPMSRHTPLRVGGHVGLWIVVDSLVDLKDTLRATRKHKIPWRIHWPFQDWLVRDAGFSGAIIRMGREFETVTVSDQTIRIGAASPWSALGHITTIPIGRWPGTPGGLFGQGEQHRLKGLSMTLRWLRGRQIIDQTVNAESPPPALKRTEVLLDMTLTKRMRRFVRLKSPSRTGQLFSAPKGMQAAQVLSDSGLCGTRLKT